MEHNWTLQELHAMKASIKREIEAIEKAHLKELYGHLNTVQHLLNTCEDGYTYWTCVRSYGSSGWKRHFNRQSVDKLVDQYGDGYDGLVDIYTDNPRLLRRVGTESYACDTYHTLEELPEEKDDEYAGNPFTAGVMMGLKAINAPVPSEQ